MHVIAKKGISTTKPQLGYLVESGATITTVEASERVYTSNYVTTVGASDIPNAEQLSHQTELSVNWKSNAQLSVGYLGRAWLAFRGSICCINFMQPLNKPFIVVF